MTPDQKRLQKEYMVKLKAEIHNGPRAENNTEQQYKIRIIERGERLFYQCHDKALICEFDPYSTTVFLSSIRKWDDGKKMNPEERELYLERLKLHFLRFHDHAEIHFG